MAWATAAAAQAACGLPPLPEGPPAGARHVSAQGADQPDDEAVRQALAALRPGDWLVFAPGRYRFAHRVEVHTPGVTLWGRGAELLALDPGDQALGVRADGVQVIGFTLRGVTDGRRTNPESARLSARPAEERGPRLHGVVLRENRILSGASAGIYLAAVEGFTVAGNQVSGTLADGIHMTDGARDGQVVGNRVEHVGDDGISIVSYAADAHGPVHGVRVEDNDVADLPWGRGLSVVGGEDVTLRGNRIARVARAAGVLIAREDGWHTAGVQRVRVEDNTVRDTQPGGPVTGHAAIEVHALGRDETVQDVLVRANRIDGGSTDGVRIGADSRPGALRRVQLQDNRISGVAGEPLAVLRPEALGPVAAAPRHVPCGP